MRVRFTHPEPGEIVVSIPVDVPNHLMGEWKGKDVNLVLRMQGRTLYYFAKWAPISKRHRLQCIDALIPNKPILRLEPGSSSQSAVYRLSGVNP